MKAIRVRFAAATNYKPSRVTATDADRHSVTVSRDSFDTFEMAADEAVRLLCEKMDWPGAMISGGFGEDLFYVFTPKRESFPRGEMMREAMQKSSFVAAYVEALFFTESGDDNLKDKGVDDMSFDIVTRITRDCNIFETACSNDIGLDPRQAGHDFWLTRNGHGAGFWDGDWDKEVGERLTNISKSFGEMNTYIGDDGLIYC